MTLEEYFKETGENDTIFAKKIGKSRQYIHGIRTGSMRPGSGVQIDIFKETEGKVGPEDLLVAFLPPADVSGEAA
ncbi:MAG: hypothetical protein V3W41_22525 [Planctomycetota bacterium]